MHKKGIKWNALMNISYITTDNYSNILATRKRLWSYELHIHTWGVRLLWYRVVSGLIEDIAYWKNY